MMASRPQLPNTASFRQDERGLLEDRRLFKSLLSGELNDSDNLSSFAFNRSLLVPPNISNDVRIPLYIVIFTLSLVGNSLVIATLVQNRKMRTVTNVFLLNLAVSDLLLSVFCMPFTLIPNIMRTFVFGKVVCVVIRYCQGISVAVSCFTLMAISLERYFAICRPLRSRSWQTLSHAYKTIATCWMAAILIMLPVALNSTTKSHQRGDVVIHMCRETWPDPTAEKAYAILLDVVLLVFPLALMSACYGSVVDKMWKSMRIENNKKPNDDVDISGEDDVETTMTADNNYRSHSNTTSVAKRMRSDYSRVMRSKKASKQNAAKRRVIVMLFMVVLEYFVCWTPLYVLITWKVFDKLYILHHISPLTMSLVYLLAYTSSCCNPITYCFMNKKFRQGFMSAFGCCRPCRGSRRELQHKIAYPYPVNYGYKSKSGTASVKMITGRKSQRTTRPYELY